MVMFKKATRTQKKLRLALLGPAGAGKTRTALEIAKGLGSKIALIDTEHGSATMFAHLVDFETVELMNFAPERYVEAIDAAEEGGFDVLVIDSLSHAWSGKGGILEFVDRTKKNGNSFNAWGDATPMQNKLVERLLTCKLHLIVTMRTKMEFVQEKDPSTGKTIVRKIGMQPVQRDGVEYEFDVIADIDQNHTLTIAKTRIDEIEGEIIEKAGVHLGVKLAKWLATGAEAKKIEAPEKFKPASGATDKAAVVLELARLGVAKVDAVRAVRQMNLGVLPEVALEWAAILVDLKEMTAWEWEQGDAESKAGPPSSTPSSGLAGVEVGSEKATASAATDGTMNTPT